MKKETYKIHGMHCASCVAMIERVLAQTEGVRAAAVNFASESALVEFDDSVVSADRLAAAVKDVGYHLQVPSQSDSHLVENDESPTKVEAADNSGTVADGSNTILMLKVLGMDSPHCAMVVEGALKKLAGLINVDVDFSNQRAKVVFDSALLKADDISRVVSDAGYQPLPEEGPAADLLDREKNEREKQLKILKIKLTVGAVLSTMVFLGSFPEWFSFIPGILSNSWTLLLLTAPVQFWVGAQFYSGLKLLFKYHTADMNTLWLLALAATLRTSLTTTPPTLMLMLISFWSATT